MVLENLLPCRNMHVPIAAFMIPQLSPTVLRQNAGFAMAGGIPQGAILFII